MKKRSFVDARGRNLKLPTPPRRIISLIPSLTETLFALGAGERVVGVSRHCKYPAEDVARRQRVGGIHNPDREKILSLQPDLIIANMEENRKEDVEFLDANGLRVYVTFPRTIEEAIGLIEELGRLTDTAPRAAQMAEEIREEHERTRSSAERFRRLRVFYPVWRDPYYSINRDTFIHHVLAACKADNVFADAEKRYFPTTLDEVAARRPEVILLPSEPYVFRAEHMADFLPYENLPAVENKRVLLVDGEMICWYGVRMREGLPYLRKLFKAVNQSL